MSFSTQTHRGKATVAPPTTPLIYNVISPATPDTEFSQTLSDGVKKFIIRNRGKKDIQLTFTATESGTKYITIPGNASMSEDGVFLTGVTIYMQVSAVSQIIEILEWT